MADDKYPDPHPLRDANGCPLVLWDNGWIKDCAHCPANNSAIPATAGDFCERRLGTTKVDLRRAPRPRVVLTFSKEA